MKYISQFVLFLGALGLLMTLQYQYWLGNRGYYAQQELQNQITAQQQQNDTQAANNMILRSDVHDLKTGLEAVEEHARLDLGLIKPGETFVQFSTAPVTHSRFANQVGEPDDVYEPTE